MKFLRKLYDWVLSWADHPAGPHVMCLIAFVESFIFPVPPDLLLIALSLGKPEKAIRFAFLCSMASVSGGIIGYVIGFGFWHVTRDFFLTYVFSQEVFDKVRLLYNDNAFLAVFTAGFAPIPYKVFTVSAGVFSINFFVFLLASVISRSARFLIVATLIRIFGESVKSFIDKYFNLLTIVFSALLIGGFIIVKFLI